jgi:uncharacterized protein (TIRG00374 family)
LTVAGIGLIAALARRVTWSGVVATLRGLSLPWLLAALALAMLSVSARALRLTLVLGPPTGLIRVWRSVCLGYFGSLFLPLGGGELVKVAALHRQTGLSLPRVGTALALDRMFDVATLLTLLLSVLGQGAIRTLRPGPVLVLAAGGAVLLALLLFLVLSGDRLRNRLLSWALQHPGRHAWIHRFDEIHDQTLALRKPTLLPRLGLLQACVFSVDILASWCCLLAFPLGAGLPAAAALRLAFFSMIAFGVPLLPGGLGSHQAASIIALAPFGIAAAQALAVSLAGEATHVAALSCLGIAAMVGSGLNPFRLARQPAVVDSHNPKEEP